MTTSGSAATPPREPRARLGRVVMTLLWIALKLTLIAAFVNRNAADFVYAGF